MLEHCDVECLCDCNMPSSCSSSSSCLLLVRKTLLTENAMGWHNYVCLFLNPTLQEQRYDSLLPSWPSHSWHLMKLPVPQNQTGSVAQLRSRGCGFRKNPRRDKQHCLKTLIKHSAVNRLVRGDSGANFHWNIEENGKVVTCEQLEWQEFSEEFMTLQCDHQQYMFTHPWVPMLKGHVDSLSIPACLFLGFREGCSHDVMISLWSKSNHPLKGGSHQDGCARHLLRWWSRPRMHVDVNAEHVSVLTIRNKK